MPIGDLLASITGEKPTPSSSTVTRTVLSAPKRKADEELRGTPAKSPRPGLPSNGPSRQGSDLSKPASRPVNNGFLTSSSTGKSVSANRHSDRPVASATMKHTRETPSKQMSASSPANGSRPVPVRPSANRPSPVGSGPKSEPKKRSFAEIMARAKAAQTAAPNLGRIQHKTLDRGVSKKDREEAKAEGGRKPRTATRQDAIRGRGASSSRYGTPSSQDQDRQRQGHASSPAGMPLKGKGGKVVAIEEKKVKKAAIATTGYTGTARPRPGAASSKSNGSSSKPSSASRARPQDRRLYGGALSASRRQHEGEDDDMDDFIEYDDEEPAYGYGGGGGYESPEESDMEAGLSDIDQEERRAEYHARREDQEQEALEKRLRREKEEKRRKLLEAARARGR